MTSKAKQQLRTKRAWMTGVLFAAFFVASFGSPLVAFFLVPRELSHMLVPRLLYEVPILMVSWLSLWAVKFDAVLVRPGGDMYPAMNFHGWVLAGLGAAISSLILLCIAAALGRFFTREKG